MTIPALTASSSSCDCASSGQRTLPERSYPRGEEGRMRRRRRRRRRRRMLSTEIVYDIADTPTGWDIEDRSWDMECKAPPPFRCLGCCQAI